MADKVYIIGMVGEGLAVARQFAEGGMVAEVVTLEQAKEKGLIQPFEREPIKITSMPTLSANGLYTPLDFNNRSGRRKKGKLRN